MTGKQFGGNEERRLFVNILKNQSDLMPHGDLYEFEQWDGGGDRTTTRYYSQLMYNTRIVPCPLGMLQAAIRPLMPTHFSCCKAHKD